MRLCQVCDRPSDSERCPSCAEDKTFTIGVVCPQCKGQTVPITEALDLGKRLAVLRCKECRYELMVRLMAVPVRDNPNWPGDNAGHGTQAGYLRHRRARETPCEACRYANTRAEGHDPRRRTA